MSTRALGVIAAAAVLLALLALYGHERSAMSSGSASGALLLPKLSAELNDIDQLRVVEGGNKTVATLKRTHKGWTVSQKDGYPADIGKIRKVLVALSKAKIVEQKTSDPKYYDRLGVEPIKLASAAGTAVAIKGPDHPPPMIILGGTEDSYRYARLANQSRSYLVDQNPDVPKDATGWLDTEIINVPGKRVEDVVIRHADGKTLQISKKAPSDTDFAVADVPKGRRLLYPGVADVIGNSLRSLKLQDVARAGDGTAKPDATAVFQTFDGLVITAKGRKRDGKPWVTFAASVDPQRLPKSANSKGGADAAKGNGAKQTANAADAAKTKSGSGKPSAADIRAEAKKINARVSGWQYQIPTYQYDQMTRRMSDLLKAKGKQKPKKASR